MLRFKVWGPPDVACRAPDIVRRIIKCIVTHLEFCYSPYHSITPRNLTLTRNTLDCSQSNVSCSRICSFTPSLPATDIMNNWTFQKATRRDDCLLYTLQATSLTCLNEQPTGDRRGDRSPLAYTRGDRRGDRRCVVASSRRSSRRSLWPVASTIARWILPISLKLIWHELTCNKIEAYQRENDFIQEGVWPHYYSVSTKKWALLNILRKPAPI